MNRRGGYRPNAGRKKNSGKWSEPTKAIRVPISKLDAIYKLLLLPSDKSAAVIPEKPPSLDSLISTISDIYYRPLYTAATFINALPHQKPTEKFNLNAYLLPHPERMVFVHAPDRSMRDAGIDEGDMLILDTHRPLSNGSIVAAIVNDELLIREVLHDKEGIILAAANPLYSPIHLAGEIHFTLLGVVRLSCGRCRDSCHPRLLNGRSGLP